MIFDDNGNVVYQEGGSLNHTGYGDSAEPYYSGNTAAHNHPKGVAPYPSDTDFDTFQERKIKKMVVVSPDYTVTVKEDPKYKGAGRSSITYNMKYTSYSQADNELRKKRQKGEITQKEYNQQRREIKFKFQKEACKRAGYIMTVTENKKKK